MRTPGGTPRDGGAPTSELRGGFGPVGWSVALCGQTSNAAQHVMCAVQRDLRMADDPMSLGAGDFMVGEREEEIVVTKLCGRWFHATFFEALAVDDLALQAAGPVDLHGHHLGSPSSTGRRALLECAGRTAT